MAVGITCLHPCLGWGNACDPRAVQLQNSPLDDIQEIQGTSAGLEAAAFPFLAQQRGRSLTFICPHPGALPSSQQLPVVPSYPYIFLRCPQQTQGKENGVWVCLYVGRGKGRNRSFPRDSDGSPAALPKQAQPFGSPWLCVEASGLLPTRNCAAKNSCTCLIPLCTHRAAQADPGNAVPSQLAVALLPSPWFPASIPSPPCLQPLGKPQLCPMGLRVPFLLFPLPWFRGSRTLTSSSSDLLSPIGLVLGRTCLDLLPPPWAFEGSHVGSCTHRLWCGKATNP